MRLVGKKLLPVLLSLLIVSGIIGVRINENSLFILTAEAANPYPQYNYYNSASDYQIACTWYAWQQANERLGLSLPIWGDAGSWYGSANYQKGSEPLANSIACWSFDNSPPYGHVAYVTGVNSDGSINIVEGGSDIENIFLNDPKDWYKLIECKATIDELAGNFYQCKTSVILKPGSSGSPVFRNGKVFGILHGGQEGTNHCVFQSSSSILSLIRQAQII